MIYSVLLLIPSRSSSTFLSISLLCPPHLLISYPYIHKSYYLPSHHHLSSHLSSIISSHPSSPQLAHHMTIISSLSSSPHRLHRILSRGPLASLRTHPPEHNQLLSLRDDQQDATSN